MIYPIWRYISKTLVKLDNFARFKKKFCVEAEILKLFVIVENIFWFFFPNFVKMCRKLKSDLTKVRKIGKKITLEFPILALHSEIWETSLKTLKWENWAITDIIFLSMKRLNQIEVPVLSCTHVGHDIHLDSSFFSWNTWLRSVKINLLVLKPVYSNPWK